MIDLPQKVIVGSSKFRTQRSENITNKSQKNSDNRDRTIRLLQYLFTITMSASRVKEVSRRIVDALSRELNLDLVIMYIEDSTKGEVLPVAMNHLNVSVGESELLQDMNIPIGYEGNLIVKSIKEREKKSTDMFIDLVSPASGRNLNAQIEKMDLKNFTVYPLTVHEKILGSLVIGKNSVKENVEPSELSILETLVTVIGVAIERGRLQEDLERASDKLKELDHLKDEFVMLASHELRTPMTAIKGSLSTILEGYAGNIDPKAQEFLTAAYNENERLMRIVNNLLTISKMQAGRFKFNITKVNIKKITDDVVTNMQMAAKEKELYIKFPEQENLPEVYADEDKVKEVLVNLIGNAIKFTHRGGVTIKVVEQNSDIIVSVTDTGSGIKEEERDLLFQKYSQLQNNYSQQTGGTGLGLYICKQNIKGMNGKIWLESTLGVGSTFLFSLPIAP